MIKHSSGKYSKLIKDLSGKHSPVDHNQPITFSGVTATKLAKNLKDPNRTPIIQTRENSSSILSRSIS